MTIPHKVDIIPLLDDVDELAGRIGSVNTVLNDGGELRGSSTDGPGALGALLGPAVAFVAPPVSDSDCAGSGP